MRRDLLLVTAMATLFCAMLLGAASALLAAPPVPADLLPSTAALARVEALGGGRQLVVARLGPRQSFHAMYDHLVGRGWRLRRVNVLPEDEDQVYLRRSMAGYLLEVAIVARGEGGRGAVSVTYWRCVRYLTCGRG